jgi:hypothetical protein
LVVSAVSVVSGMFRCFVIYIFINDSLLSPTGIYYSYSLSVYLNPFDQALLNATGSSFRTPSVRSIILQDRLVSKVRKVVEGRPLRVETFAFSHPLASLASLINDKHLTLVRPNLR